MHELSDEVKQVKGRGRVTMALMFNVLVHKHVHKHTGCMYYMLTTQPGKTAQRDKRIGSLDRKQRSRQKVKTAERNDQGEKGGAQRQAFCTET